MDAKETARNPLTLGDTLSVAEDRLHVVTVCIEHEGSVVARRIALGGVAKPGRAIINPTGLGQETTQ